MYKRCLIFVALFAVACVNGFVAPGSKNVGAHSKVTIAGERSNSALMGRKWNFNNGRSPFGLKNNAEIWNGRVAQMGFTVVLLQELITGKGVVAGLQDGDFFSKVMLGATVVSVFGLTIFLTIKGKESTIDY
mmetsp:Transcript_1981/g.1854  ORF Transcript_1981/g.1854 Transcript_1981/m.1854 type:complete len:132 (-) Transcript_1981:359-754(-)|eukprot:CAMPEP_0197831866 /NCGR_PEP_ID=MMETSP1437-20131217/12520_1 /TAXON_ID=49252 ORGANISM="Eucampia antarctica, Strain CCMP1452" /NCGR_SAMPLE_ID=MMETSP1437 /ASSEMBLY_ACC=CAM_ASM_001096 /LENGTH=131 /DNA_ID=CAMNT_0043434973 /DNA_START=75 /DNA_END=470 /DNA_ORIENTATION=+